jgi:hypothetical protein
LGTFWLGTDRHPRRRTGSEGVSRHTTSPPVYRPEDRPAVVDSFTDVLTVLPE